MTQDEIIEMAKKAGISTGSRFVGNELVGCVTIEVQVFAKLVAAKEREACAKLCDACICTAQASEAIRARGRDAA